MTRRFRIALSYAGEKRDFVAPVARLLARRFGEARVLYDKFHRAEFARAALTDLGDAPLRRAGVHRTRQDADSALADHLAALHTFERLVALDASAASARQRLSTALYRLATCHLTDGRLEDAAQASAEDIRVGRGIVEEEPDNLRWRHDLADSGWQADAETVRAYLDNPPPSTQR